MNKEQIFSLIDSLNREGFDNTVWGLADVDTYTDELLGTAERIRLNGMFLYVYCRSDQGPETWSFVPDVDYSYALPMRDDPTEVVYIYEW